ncbi:hypothetical protein [Paraburkholderia strydomiana]|uniref:hypothetical protein n=1 Tax=Paraburkholderia strydomiana TaxID=1245417 RepID=UPI001BEA9B20|nr:hypothetical protein [Paraburkholderia strydomiana]MBT2795279.1 hypothetical protein [Paraburkholderia strydomiana]
MSTIRAALSNVSKWPDIAHRNTNRRSSGLLRLQLHPEPLRDRPMSDVSTARSVMLERGAAQMSPFQRDEPMVGKVVSDQVRWHMVFLSANSASHVH